MLPEAATESGRRVERRLARDVVDAAREDVVEKRGERRIHVAGNSIIAARPP